MDWPELSSKMTPVDDKEKNAELLTAQTETQLNNTDDDIRLKPLQPVPSYSLPESTKSQNENSDCGEDSEDMAVNLDDIGGAVSVGDEIMCSVDQFEIKNDDLNLLTEQIPNAIDDVLKIVSDENVSDEDLEKDLTGPVEENKELKSICEIITPNSTLTSLVLPDDSVVSDKLDLLQSKSSDHMLISGLDNHMGCGNSIDDVEKINICEEQPDVCNDISSGCDKNHDENVIVQDNNSIEDNSSRNDNVISNEADNTIDTVSSRNENDCITDEYDISMSDDCLSAVSSCSDFKKENIGDKILRNGNNQCETDVLNETNDGTEALRDCHNSKNFFNVDCNKNTNLHADEMIVNRALLSEEYPSNSMENIMTENKEIIHISSSKADSNEISNDDSKCVVNSGSLKQTDCIEIECGGENLLTISDKGETMSVFSSCGETREEITPLDKIDATSSSPSTVNENDKPKIIKVNDLSSSDLLKEDSERILENVDSLLSAGSERVDCLKESSEKSLKSEECSKKSVCDKVDHLHTPEVDEDVDCSEQELISLNSENVEDACASIASNDTSVELLCDEHDSATSGKENFNSGILSEVILKSVLHSNGHKKGIFENEECIEVLSEENDSSVDRKDDSEDECVLVECVKQDDIKSRKVCDSVTISHLILDSISSEGDKLKGNLDSQTSSVDGNKTLCDNSALCKEPVPIPKSPSVSCVQSEKTILTCVNSDEKVIDNKNTIVPNSKENSNIEPSVQNDKTSLPVPLNIPIPSQKMPLMLPINLENLNVSCVRNEKTILSVPERNSDCKSQREAVPALLPVKGENTKQISEAVKFFFQQGSSRLDKFLGAKHPSSPLQNNPVKVSVRKSSTDSEPTVLSQNKTVPDLEQRPRSCETAESGSIPIAFFPESFIDSSGRKLPPLLPKIPMAFLISDMRSLPPSSVPSSEHKHDGVSVAGVSSTVSTVTSSSSVSSIGVNTNFGAESTIMPPRLHRIPKQQQKPKKCNRVKHIPQIPGRNQLPLNFINTLNAMNLSGAGFIAANVNNGQLGDIKSVEQLLMKSSNNQKPQMKIKGLPRNKVVRQPSRVSTSTSIDDGLTSSNVTNFGGGGGVCGRRLQNVVNKLHQAIDPGTVAAAGISHDSILHNLLASKDKQPNRSVSGPVKPSVQCLKVVESTPSSQNNIVTTFRIPSALTIIPQAVKNSQSKSTETPVPKIPEVISDSVEDSVINRLKKLGTVIEFERDPPPQCVTPLILPPPPPLTPICMTRTLQQNVNHSGFSNSGAPDITAQCLRMLESLAKTDNAPNIPKKRPQQRKRQNSVTNKQISTANSIKNNQNSAINLLPIKSKEILKSDTISSGNFVQNSSEISSVSSVNMPLSSVQTSSSQTTNSVSASSVPAIEHIMPSSSTLSSSADDDVKPVPSCGILESSVSSVEQESSVKLPVTKPAQEPEQIEPKFVFQIDSSQVLTLPNGQRMLTCEVCDGVYHKTMSLKRHYLRTHINKKYISESDQIMCGMIHIDAEEPQPPKKVTKVFIGDLSNWINTSMPGLFKCFTCGACFDQKSELRTHLMEHPPVSLLKVKDGPLETFMCSGCSKTFARKKLFVQHRKICDQNNETPLLNQHCLYCDKSFLSIAFRNKHHFKLHHPKRKHQPCFICKSEKNKDTSALFRHLCLQHKDKYFGCIQCKLRFLTRTELNAHNKEEHSPRKFDKKQKKSDDEEKKVGDEDNSEQKNKMSISVKDSLGKHKCSVCSKPFSSELNVSRHFRLAHGVHPRRKVQPPKLPQVTTVKEEEKPKIKENKEIIENLEPKNKSAPSPSPVVMDPETLFYSRISFNIRENLLHHLDGKLDSQEVLEFDLNTPADQASKNKVMNFSASFTSSRGSTDTETSVSDSRHSSNPVSPKVPWEKFNFPKNYDGRCGLTSYIKDMSHLDISTQLTMRRNLQRLNSTVEIDPSPDILADIPAGLSLIGSSCAETFGDNEKSTSKEENKGTELSGEWTRPRSYVCAVCNHNTSNLWELEDHKLALHPNVWCPHHEVLAEHTSCWELVYNRVAPAPILHPPLPVELPPMNTTNRCTKCNKYYPNSSDLHRHMLDCGGDTTWMSTMLAVSSPGGTRRNRKWRPFGSRRRRQQGRRGMKRNIPNTPAKQPGMRVRTKPGDMESIQKMLANLPPKRVTRRIIGEDGEIKTRSQGTLSSASVGVSVMQRSRSSLAKYVKKFDGSKSVGKNLGTTVGKGMKDIKSSIEDKKDNLKFKKMNKPVRRILGESPVKKIQETSNEIKSEDIEFKDVKKEKTDDTDGVKCEALCQSDSQITGSYIAGDGKVCVKSEVVPKGDYKEINIVVVSSGKRMELPDSGVETSSDIVQVLKKKKTHENEGDLVDKSESKVDVKEKLLKTTARSKPREDRGVNTNVLFKEITAGIAASSGCQLIKSEVENNDTKSTGSPKKQLKEKKDESERKKLIEIGEKKKIEGAKNKANAEDGLIICNGCGIQFDSASACLRHMKKCVFRKEEKVLDEDDDIQGSHTCGLCNQTFPYLMALLRHKCESPSEDRVMPELIREEPFESAPVENTKDIPVLSPEDIQKGIIEKSATTKEIKSGSVSPVKQSSEKKTINKCFYISPEDVQKSITEKSATTKEIKSGSVSPVKQSSEKKTVNKSTYKRTSTVESLANTILEVSQETFSIDHFIWINGTISHKKESVVKLIDPNLVSPAVTPASTVNQCQEPSNEENNFPIESRDSVSKKATEDIVIVNSTIKTVPKLVKIKSPIISRKALKGDVKTNSTKVSTTSTLQKSPRIIKRKQIGIKQKRRNKNRKIVLNRPVMRKKRSTALEILLRENRLMAESRKPVKTVEKRRSNSPIRGIARRFGKRRKLKHYENSKRDGSGENFVKTLLHSGEKMEDIPEREEDLNEYIEGVEIENENHAGHSGNKLSLLPQDVPAEDNNGKNIESNKEEVNIDTQQHNDEEKIIGIVEDPSEKTENSPKSRSRSPSKKLKLNECLIITGSRRKTNAINRWDMYRPSCSNGKVYCEPCNKEVKEDSMAKHEQSTSHSKNFDLKNDFDNLFPDAYKFVTKCSECSWNFPTPFTCYKHYLQKHESSLLLLLEQVMAENKDIKGVFEPSSNKSDASSSSKRDDAVEDYNQISMAENRFCNNKNEENDFKQTIKEEPGSIKKLEPMKSIEDNRSFKQSEIPEDLGSSDQSTSEELRSVNSHKYKTDNLQNKTVLSGAKLIYCDVCNKGIKLETMNKHEQSYVHKKNSNLKKEFCDKFSEEKQKLFPVYCEKCNWHFTSPFLCYKHYLWKHANEVAHLFESLELNNGNDDKSIPSGQTNPQETELGSETFNENNNCERLSPDVSYSEINTSLTSPSHLFCKVCNKKVKFSLIFKHVNTSFHKQNLGSGLESVTIPAECKWCQRVAGSPFLCCEHNKNLSESVAIEKKKRKKKKVSMKKEKETADTDSDRLLSTVQHGKVVKKRKKLKLKRIREKLPSFLNAMEAANVEKAVEIRTDISANISSDRLLKRRKKRFRFSQIRNNWKVSVVDPGLATISDSSLHNVKVEVKTENPEPLKSSFLDVPIIPKAAPSENVKPMLGSTSAAAATERRSSSVSGSEFYCLLCQKQFSSAVLLVRHQNSSVHKYNESRNKKPPRFLKLRINSDSSNGSILSKRSESLVPNIKSEPTNSNLIKSKDVNIAGAGSLPVTPTPPISQFQGSEGSETSQEWNDKCVNLERRGSVDQPSSNINQDWTHEWVMSGTNSVVPQWDLNSSIGQSQLWDNSDNNFMNAAGYSSSLGSILDSVNKILADECGDPSLLPHYSLSELQSAMGASDEEMAMLQQLGERSLQDDFIYDGAGSVCSQNEQWSVSGSTSAPGSNIDDNTTTLMDLDNQQPPPPPPPPSVSQQESVAPNNGANTSSSTAVSTSNNTSGQSSSVKTEPVDLFDNLVDKTSCRGLNGRPRRLLSDYESREMVCPSCSKHFLGLSALETHLSWSKCSQNTNNNSNSTTRTNIWLRRKAMFNQPEDVDRRLVCFICKEIFNCPSTLNKHVASNHMKKDTRAQLSVNQNSDGSDGAEKLKSKMSNALGGLLDRALNNLLCSKAPNLGLSGQDSSGAELSSGTIQLLGKLCATRLKSEVSGSLSQAPNQCRQPPDKTGTSKSFNSTRISTSEFKEILSRGGKPKTDSANSSNNIVSTNALGHVVLANGQEQRPYACPICDDRFLIPSTRNRHIARAHGRYGRNQLIKMTEERDPPPEQDNPIETNPDNEFDQDWRDVASPSCDSDAEDAEKDVKVKPLCSDCGLSFPTFQDVIQHRKELHPKNVVKEESDLPVSENIVDSTSGEGKRRGKRSPRSTGNKEPTEQVVSSKQITRSRRRLRNNTLQKSEKEVSSESEPIKEGVDKDLCSDSNEKTEEINKKDDGSDKNSTARKLSTTVKRRKSLEGSSNDNGDDGSEDSVVKKKTDKRKVRLAHLAQEDVRVKAEAALRELNLPKRNRIQTSQSKWGIETIKFTKQNSAEMLRSSTSAHTRTNSASVTENKWKVPNISTSQSEASIKVGPLCQSTNESSKFTDIYDFNDEELCPKKITLHYGQQRDDKDGQEDDNAKSSHCKEDIKSSVDS